MRNIFLSASVPSPERRPEYFRTADVNLIREAVKALVYVCCERGHRLVFGGHPAITPLVALLYRQARRDPAEHVRLYQSAWFAPREGVVGRPSFPEENRAFGDLVLTEPARDLAQSLAHMRRRMLEDDRLDCGIFIGGMEGVEEEYNLYREFQRTPRVPVPSTGGAALRIWERGGKEFDVDPDERSYTRLFRRVLPE